MEQLTELTSRLTEAEERYVPITDDEEQRLLELGSDLPQLWRHAATTVDVKKRILRTVIQEIVVDAADDPPRTELRIHWQGGIHTRLTVARNPQGKHGRGTSDDVIQLIRELSKVCDDRTIAAVLNRLGHRTGVGNTWQSSRIADVRHHYQIPNFSAGDQWVTMSQAAKELGVSSTVILSLIDERVLPAQQVVACAPWIIERAHLNLPLVRDHVEAVRRGKRRPSTSGNQREFPWKHNEIDEV